MKASRGSGRFGPKVLQKAILAFYNNHKLFPKGITAEMAAVDLWSLKMGRALSRLVSGLNHSEMLFTATLRDQCSRGPRNASNQGCPLPSPHAAGGLEQECQD